MLLAADQLLLPCSHYSTRIAVERAKRAEQADAW